MRRIDKWVGVAKHAVLFLITGSIVSKTMSPRVSDLVDYCSQQQKCTDDSGMTMLVSAQCDKGFYASTTTRTPQRDYAMLQQCVNLILVSTKIRKQSLPFRDCHLVSCFVQNTQQKLPCFCARNQVSGRGGGSRETCVLASYINAYMPLVVPRSHPCCRGGKYCHFLPCFFNCCVVPPALWFRRCDIDCTTTMHLH